MPARAVLHGNKKNEKTLSVSHPLASSPVGGALMLTELNIKTSPFGRGGIAEQ